MLTRKKILVFADWYEPGYKAGGPIRSCVNFSENMKDTHEIFVFTTDRDLGETQPYENVEIDKWIKNNEVNVFYASPYFLAWRNIRRVIESVSPDYVYINSMYSVYIALYPLLLKRLGGSNSTFVLAPRGMLKATALQFKSTKKKVFLFFFKLLGFYKLITFHATDKTEEADIRTIFGKNVTYRRISNFPSKQDFGTYDIVKLMDDLKIVFVGRIHPIKNLKSLLLYIQSVSSTVKLTIIGTIEDENYWDECERIINTFNPRIKVILKRNVPNTDIINLILDQHIFALPTEGENFGHAIFEALSAGRPVLISDQTPWRNLEEKKAGWDLSLNDPQAFINVLNNVAAMDNEEFQKWCKGARRLANDYINNSNLKEQYLNLFS